MNVAAILKQKGRAVTTAGASTTLMEVAEKLAAKRIGAIVIVAAHAEVAGIVSERDIIRALAAHGSDCLSQPVSEVMTKQVVTCQETDTLDERRIGARGGDRAPLLLQDRANVHGMSSHPPGCGARTASGLLAAPLRLSRRARCLASGLTTRLTSILRQVAPIVQAR